MNGRMRAMRAFWIQASPRVWDSLAIALVTRSFPSRHRSSLLAIAVSSSSRISCVCCVSSALGVRESSSTAFAASVPVAWTSATATSPGAIKDS